MDKFPMDGHQPHCKALYSVESLEINWESIMVTKFLSCCTPHLWSKLHCENGHVETRKMILTVSSCFDTFTYIFAGKSRCRWLEQAPQRQGQKIGWFIFNLQTFTSSLGFALPIYLALLLHIRYVKLQKLRWPTTQGHHHKTYGWCDIIPTSTL